MDLLNYKPVSRDPDDGVKVTYECQACLHVTTVTVNVDGIPNRIPCSLCRFNEEGDES